MTKNKTKISLIIVSKITYIFLPCKRAKTGSFFFFFLSLIFLSLLSVVRVYFFFLSFLVLSLLFMGKVCGLVSDLFCFSLLSSHFRFYSFFAFFYFSSESTSPLDFNYSGLFFGKIVNKQILNFLSACFRELIISQLDHKSEFLLKNP